MLPEKEMMGDLDAPDVALPGSDMAVSSADAGSGGGDKKKVIILLALAVVAAGVIGFQFLGGKGPATAQAVATGSAPGGGSNEAEVESVLKRLDSKPRPEDGPTVHSIESIVKEFDTYVQNRQIPLSELRCNPFRVVLTQAEPREDEISKAKGDTAAAEEAKALHDRVAAAVSKLKLGSVMIVGPKRMALISGTLCRNGDIVGEMRVESIEADSVTLSMEGRTVVLTMKR